MGSEQKRAFIAVALSGLVLVLWQMYFAPTPVETKQPSTKVQESSASVPANQSQPSERREAVLEPSQEIVQTTHDLSLDGHRFSFQNDLTVQNILNDGAVFDFQSIAGATEPFHIEVITGNNRAEKLYFELPETNGQEDVLTGHNSTYGIQFEAKLNNEGKLDFRLSASQEYAYRFIFRSRAEKLENNQIREFIIYTNDVLREDVGDNENGDGFIKWFGVDFNYHLFAFIFPEKIRARYEMTSAGVLVVDMLDPVSDFHGELVFSKKNYDTLSDLGHNLHLAVDFGFFGIIAVPILRGLEFFYKFFPNYGVAIILLTLVIRLLTFPLQYKSFKSMKKMQVIQPELVKIREKHKEDPQRMQKETMELFKRAGANPLGGCLPLLAQMPIFFAFYQVLYNAVELVGSPFIFWLTDLSVKDPYYVLPILMSGSILLQMRLNPTPTADPMQKKIMMFMPVVFAFIMKDLPSGLNLYMFVSTLFGIIQQMFVYKMTD